ncbi:MAG: PAS domain S-box protein [Bacteroidales bacterium]|nr:PAS domain S-box protein [Bacteroidales bacterium]
MKFFENISGKRKLFLLVITVFAVSIIAAASYAAISIFNSSKQISENTAQIINDNYANHIAAEIEKGVSLTKTISNSIVIKGNQENYFISKDQENVFYNHIDNNELITDLFLILNPSLKFEQNYDSLIVYEFSLHKSNTGISKNIYDERNFITDFSKLKKLKAEQKVIVSEPVWLKFTKENKLVILIVSPLFQNESLIGALGINYSLDNISKIVNIPLIQTGNTKSIVLSDKKVIVSVTGKKRMAGKNILNIEGEEHDIYNHIISNNYNFSNLDEFTGAYKSISIEQADLKWDIITTVPYNAIIRNLIRNIYVSIIIASLIMLAGLFVMIYFIRRSFSPFDIIIEAARKISLGEPAELPSNNSKNEFGKLINSINSISDNLKEASVVSSEIASGNFESKLKVKSENDMLSSSINQIAVTMKSSYEENIKQEQSTFQQLWMRRGRFEVSEAERKSKNNIHDISFNIIRVLVKFTEAVLGGIYLYNKDENIIELIAAYAYGNRKQMKREFKPGVGLVGACFIEKKKIVLDKISEDYIKVSSGLGSGTPGYLALIPVFFQEKINSVIEIAFIKKPDDYVIELIEQLGDNIGAWIDASITNTKTAKLLSVSKEQTKELAEKEHELNTKVEELQNIQAEIAVQNVEYKSMMNAINHTVMTVVYTLEGIIINSNDIYEKIMGFSIEDIKGINVLDIVKDQKEDLSKIIIQVGKGIPVKRQVKRYTKNGDEKWLSATYTPYYDKDENITRVLFFAFDITEMKLELDKLKGTPKNSFLSKNK